MADGNLYICGTPIGNLKDITYRAVEMLEQVDLIAAEDTRRTSQLLNYYQLETRLTSYHEHNASRKKKSLVKRLNQGESIALVSDAGMPGISDPGYELVSLAQQEEITVQPIPGPTAMTSALVASGLATDEFLFGGFLPRKKKRSNYLRQLENQSRTMVFYESAQRIQASLSDILAVLGDRQVAVCRELTKKFEEIITKPVSQIIDKLEAEKLQGEITLVVAGGTGGQSGRDWRGLSILDHLKQKMESGLTKKEAIKEVAQDRELPKSEVYEIGTKIRVDL